MAIAAAAKATSQQQLVYGLFTPQCYTKFFTHHQFFDLQCLQLLVSKLLGYAIILGAVGVKLPQILKIVQQQNAVGLQSSMYMLELVGYTVTGWYNFTHQYPFSTYGENLFLGVQGIILVMLVSYYQHALNAKFFALVTLYLSFIYALVSGTITAAQLQSLQQSTILIFAASKLPQIYSNFQNGNTGQLSVITIGLNFFGSVARVFTTLSEVSDMTILAGQLSGVALNGLLLLQIVLYWNTTTQLSSTQPKQSKKLR